MRLRDRGFTLLEILLASVILATCLVAIAAVVTGGIDAAVDAINLRAAREACRAQLENAVVTAASSGGGTVTGQNAMTWNLQRSEFMAGATESPDEKYDIVTVTVTYPSSTASSTPGQAAGTATIKLSAITNPPDLPPPPQTGATTGSTGH